jgi:hypothetical protein
VAGFGGECHAVAEIEEALLEAGGVCVGIHEALDAWMKGGELIRCASASIFK